MKWLIKLFGGYTANEYEKEVKRLDGWNQALQIQIDAFTKSEKLILEDPIQKAIFKLTSAIEKKEYSSVGEAIFSIAEGLKPFLNESDEHKETQELIGEILKIKTSLQVSDTQAKASLVDELEVIISNSLDTLKNDPAYNQLSLSIHTLNMGTRAHNALDRAGYDIIGELIVAGTEDLAKVNGMGKKSFQEISKAMEEVGVSFEMQLPNDAVNAILEYSIAKKNIGRFSDKVSLHERIPENELITPSTILMSRNGDIIKPAFNNEQNLILKIKSKKVLSDQEAKEFDIKEISIETRMNHIKSLADAIESYRAVEGNNWKVAMRSNWKFDSFNSAHNEYVKYLKAINETGGARFITSISSTTTLQQIQSKAQNAFLSNAEFFQKLLQK
jgi:hypothetical protein